MRALVLAPSLQTIGGIERYSATLVSALQEQLGDDGVRALEAHGGRLAALTGGFRKSEKARFGLTALSTAVRWRPDVTICTHVGLAPLGLAIGRVTRGSYWVVAHGIEVWGALPAHKARALKRADRVLAVSEFTAARVQDRHGVDPSRTAILSGSLDQRLAGPPNDSPLVAGLAGRHPLVLTVGRLAASERYKGQDVVIRSLPEVAGTFPDVAYLVVGDGDDRPRLESLARELGVSDNVVFAGAVDDDVLADSYRACTMFALPAQTVLDDARPMGEGFGIALLEAMSFGKPVIGPARGAPAEFVRDGEHGRLVEPTDAAAVAAAVVDLARPGVADEMGARASAWVRDEYSYERFGTRLSALIDTLPARSKVRVA